MVDCCDSCLYFNNRKCHCDNSELHDLVIPNPLSECCNCYVPWWQEGYGDMGGMRGVGRG